MNVIKDKVLTISEVSKLIGVNDEYILVAITKGELKATYFHGEWHIRESNYLKYEKKYHQDICTQRFVTLREASIILKMSQAIILRGIRKGKIVTRDYKDSFKISLDSLLKWEKQQLNRDR